MNLRTVKAIARKESYHLLRDFRSLYLAFCLPLLLIFLFGYALSLDVDNVDIQYGQACVLTPSDFAFARDAIHAEADSNEETVLICDLDLDDLHAARSGGTVTPRLDRRPDLFKITANLIPSSEPGDRPELLHLPQHRS